jgi:hypothetical protein
VSRLESFREFQDRRRVSNEITPRDLRGTIEKRTSGAKALISRLFCTTRLMPFVQSVFPHPQPTSRSRRQNPKNIFAIREWKCTQSGSKTRDHPIYGAPHRRAQRQYPRLPARKAPPTPPQARRPRHPSAASGRRATTECAECAHFSNLSRPVGAHTPGPLPPHRATCCPPGVQRHPSDFFRGAQQTPDKLLTFL